MNSFSKPKSAIINNLPTNWFLKFIFLGILVNISTTIVASILGFPGSGQGVKLVPTLAEWGNFTFNEWYTIFLAFTLFFLTVVILVPIIEELVFRSILQYWLTKFLSTFGFVLSIAIFAGMHGNPAMFYLIPGAIFLAVMYKRHGLNGSVPGHMGFNLAGVVVMFIGSL
jgi:membrane protease YdiL (CAAX protease family)